MSSEKNLREVLADESHEIWAHWMRHMFTRMQYSQNGEWVILDHDMKRWTKQAHTPYKKLSESEKDSDRNQADKILKRIALQEKE